MAVVSSDVALPAGGAILELHPVAMSLGACKPYPGWTRDVSVIDVVPSLEASSRVRGPSIILTKKKDKLITSYGMMATC
jgi:hypothetical protein